MYLAFVDQIEKENNKILITFDVVMERSILRFLSEMPNILKVDLNEAYTAFSVVLEIEHWSDVPGLRKEIKIDRWYGMEIYEFETIHTNAIRFNDMDSFNRTAIYIKLFFLDKRYKGIKKIYKFFSLEHFHKSDEKELKYLLIQNSIVGDETFVAIYKVGQGNCTSLCSTSFSAPIVYFDFGGGCYYNAHTYPTGQRFCFSNSPPIVLSHWDNDHWSSALRNRSPQAKEYPWIVPDQPLSATQLQFAAELALLGNLHVWPRNLDKIETNYGVFFYCNGSSKNDSGLGFLYLRQSENFRTLLPGDAEYKYIDEDFKHSLSSIIASHHGGNRSFDPPPIPANTENTCVVYSYGLNNSYNHPGVIRIQEHLHYGWNRELRTVNGNIGVGLSGIPFLGCTLSQCDLEIVQI